MGDEDGRGEKEHERRGVEKRGAGRKIKPDLGVMVFRTNRPAMPEWRLPASIVINVNI